MCLYLDAFKILGEVEHSTSPGMLVHCAACIMCLGSKVDRDAGEITIRERSWNLEKQNLDKGC